MKTIIKGELLILAPDTKDEALALARWRDGRDGHPLELLPATGRGLTIRFLGSKPENGEPAAAPHADASNGVDECPA